MTEVLWFMAGLVWGAVFIIALDLYLERKKREARALAEEGE